MTNSDSDKAVDGATPRPWHLGGISGRMIIGSDNLIIADVDLKVHSDLIIQAVNERDALLAEREELRTRLESTIKGSDRENALLYSKVGQLESEREELRKRVEEAKGIADKYSMIAEKAVSDLKDYGKRAIENDAVMRKRCYEAEAKVQQLESDKSELLGALKDLKVATWEEKGHQLMYQGHPICRRVNQLFEKHTPEQSQDK
jgi:DNA repair exonuclease SbcCD ATPase subunit